MTRIHAQDLRAPHPRPTARRPLVELLLFLLALPILALPSMGCAHRVDARAAHGATIVTSRVHYNNVHAVSFDEGVVLVDAGLPEDAAVVDADLRRAGVDLTRLRAIIVTHGHTDHVGGATWFRARYGAPIYAGAGDEPLLAAGHNDHLCPTDATARRRLDASQSQAYEPLKADVLVGAEIDLRATLGLPLRIVPLPGHTAGSLVVIAEDVALVGDLFRGEIAGRGATTHFYMCDLDDNRRDVAWLLDVGAPRAQTFFVGHFGPVRRAAVDAAF